jgi:capsule polysaccharide export protein KpsE/RkpR
MEEGEGASVEDLEPENQSEPEASSASDDVPDITALKTEIEQLEQELKAKKSSLMYAQDQVEEYSKAGYARAVAEMENMRRVRLVSSNKTATVFIM